MHNKTAKFCIMLRSVDIIQKLFTFSAPRFFSGLILTLSPKSSCYSAAASHISSKSDHLQQSYDLSYRLSRWQSRWRRNAISGFVFGDVTLFRRSKSANQIASTKM